MMDNDNDDLHNILDRSDRFIIPDSDVFSVHQILFRSLWI